MIIKRLLILFGLLVCALYAAFAPRYETVTDAQAGLAVLIVVLGLLPAVAALFSASERNLMPLMPLHGLFYTISFGLPALSERTLWRVSDPKSISEALILTILGLISLYLGYYASRKSFANLRSIDFIGQLSLNRQISLAWILYGMYLLLELFPSIRDLPSVAQMTVPLGYVSIGILYSLWLDKNLAKGWQVLLIAAIVFTFMIKLLSGALAGPVFFMVFLAIVFWHKKRRIPWQFVLAGILVALLLNPIKGAYRQASLFSDSTQSSLEKAVTLYELASDYYTADDILTVFREETTTVNRLAHIALFSEVVNKTPGEVPYWAGASYETLWTSFIPRALWPDKPKAEIGQEFGHRYDMIRSDDYETSWNLPWLVEFYANFGALGVAGGMFAVGVLFSFLVQKFSAPASHRIEYVLGIALTFSLFYAESNFALMVGGVLLTYLAFFVLLRLLASVLSTASVH